jgi:sulfur carrier protein ThiS
MADHSATLKLYASLSSYLPVGARDNKVAIEVSATDTVASIIARYQLPERLVHLVLVDGVYIDPDNRTMRILRPGEVLAIWPPVAGG